MVDYMSKLLGTMFDTGLMPSKIDVEGRDDALFSSSSA